MNHPILICDDSTFAQKQIMRALPADWAVDISFAKDGVEALRHLQANECSLLFLDLTMPNMDGYQVLDVLKKHKFNIKVIVVSGDIQPDAHRRVMELGALEFIKKPVNSEELLRVIEKHGLRRSISTESQRMTIDSEILDAFREIMNVAMGQAVNMLARLLDCFVVMPVPNVNVLEVSELRMLLTHVAKGEQISAVCQGFIGNGMAGEALLIFNESSIDDIADLMEHSGDIDDAAQVELLMDISSIFIGAILKGLTDQLDAHFSQGHPVLLSLHGQASDLIRRGERQWRNTLCVEMACSIEGRKVNCDLMLLFTEDSVPKLTEIISYVIE